MQSSVLSIKGEKNMVAICKTKVENLHKYNYLCEAMNSKKSIAVSERTLPMNNNAIITIRILYAWYFYRKQMCKRHNMCCSWRI